MDINSSRHILLVEDEAIIAMSEAQILRRQGFEVSIVHDGERAIEAVDAGGIDLVLIDIDLGRNRMDGTEAAQAILENHDLPVVFLSSHTEPEVVKKTEGITSYGYIVKHAGETVMIASVKMAFRLFEANQQVKQQEHALLESRERLRITLDSIGDAVIATDIGGRVTRMNRVAEALVGWTHEEAAGKPLSEVFTKVDAEERKPVADPVAEVIASGRKLEPGNHTLLVSRNGEEYQISDSAAPIQSEDGTPETPRWWER
jgi:PAS domain S-box-containing protein